MREWATATAFLDSTAISSDRSAPSSPAPLSFPDRAQRRIKVNIFSETTFFGLENQGGHTAFLDCCALMSTRPELEVVVNAREHCDVLHSHSWGPFFFGWGSRLVAGRRIFTAHVLPATAIGAFPMAGAAQPLVRGYLRVVCDFADLVVAVGQRQLTELRKIGVTAPIRFVPNPIRASCFAPSAALRTEGRRLLGIRDDRKVVLGVGQIQPRKGIADFASIAAACPHAHFVWVGGRPFGLVSAGYLELNRVMANAPPNLRFAGMFAIERMPAVYNAADVMLFPSFQENGPYAPMEASSCGLPVVFRDLPEYERLYETPYLKARDVAGMTSATRALLASSRLHRRWADASLNLSRTFRVEQFVDTMARLYDEQACAALDEAQSK